MSHRMVTGSKDADPVPLIHGRFGYGVPKAKRNSIVLDEVEDNIADYFPAAASSSVLEEDAASHPQPAAALPSALSADHSPVGDEDSAVEPASSVEHEWTGMIPTSNNQQCSLTQALARQASSKESIVLFSNGTLSVSKFRNGGLEVDHHRSFFCSIDSYYIFEEEGEGWKDVGF